MKRITALTAAAGLAVAVGLATNPVSAQTINVPIGTSFISGAPGSTTVLGSAPVPADLIGRSCGVATVVTNQESIHPGNAVIVSSGTSSVNVAGIEEVAGSVTSNAGVLTLADTISVSLKFGTEGLSSLGSNLTVTCEPLSPAVPVEPQKETPQYSG